MTTLVSYIDDEPVTIDEAKQQCSLDDDAEDLGFVESVIIPAARAWAEQKTGAAIRKGVFTETILAGSALSVGRVVSVDSVKIDGTDVAFTTVEKGRRTIVLSAGNEGKEIDVEFTAGIDINQFPDVKAWLLLACGWMYENRELSMPEGRIDALLSGIDVPNPF